MSTSDAARHSSAFIAERTVAPTASGILDGWTVAVKDNIDVAGLPTTGGTRYLQDHVANADSDVVHMLRAAGASIVGKTKMHELGHGITGINPTCGTTLHPDDPQRTVGGSSGGSALAVRTGAARVALGTDTGGSVRIPAAFTGLIGYRPSRDRYPLSGVISISSTRDAVGVIAHVVDDVVRVDRALTGRAEVGEGLGRVTIGILESALQEPAQHFDRAFRVLADRGVRVEPLHIDRQLDRQFELGLTVLNYETVRGIANYLEPRYGEGAVLDLVNESESADVRSILEAAIKDPVSKEEYAAALGELAELHEGFVAELNGHGIDTIAYPTTTAIPPSAVALGDTEAADELRRTVLNSTPATLAGTPAITLPAGTFADSGSPAGLTIEHLGGDDELLFATARELETALSDLNEHGSN